MSGISSLLSVIAPGGKPSPERPSITSLDVHSGDARINDTKYFQYWPDEISVSKHVNWDTKNIPGLSHPLYQWVSGGAREISFTAIFSRDRPMSKTEKQSLASPVFNGFGGGDGFSDPRNVHIPSAVMWLESYMYSEYSATGTSQKLASRPKLPRKLLLGLPGMNLGRNSPMVGGGWSSPDEVPCILLQAETHYSAFFSTGEPRIAKVSLQFAEIAQLQSRVHVVDAFSLRQAANAGYKLTRNNSNTKR